MEVGLIAPPANFYFRSQTGRFVSSAPRRLAQPLYSPALPSHTPADPSSAFFLFSPSPTTARVIDSVCSILFLLFLFLPSLCFLFLPFFPSFLSSLLSWLISVIFSSSSYFSGSCFVYSSRKLLAFFLFYFTFLFLPYFFSSIIK